MVTRKRVFISMLCSFLFVYIISNCTGKEEQVLLRDYEDVVDAGVFRVAVEYSQSGYFRENDSVYGVQYQLVEELAERLGFKVEYFFEANMQKSIEDLNSGKYDMVARFIPVTTELREKVAFTESLTLDKQVLVQRRPTDTSFVYVNNQLELAGKKITVSEGSPYISRLNNLAKEIGDVIMVEELPDYDCEMLSIMVAKGDIDYTVCDFETASRLQTEYPQLSLQTSISFSQLQAWALRKDSEELLDSVNCWIRERSALNDKK